MREMYWGSEGSTARKARTGKRTGRGFDSRLLHSGGCFTPDLLGALGGRHPAQGEGDVMAQPGRVRWER